jgi:hypothetical protein
MKKLFPASLAILLIPFAIACKKGTNSTGTVTNGVARVELTFSPAIPANTTFYVDFLTRASAITGTTGYGYGSIAIPVGTLKFISDDFAVTEGQNFPCYYTVSTMPSLTQCLTFTSKIYYNNVVVSTKTFSLGSSNCANGPTSQHNAIVK